jgi:hypothetical protein
MNDIQTVLIHTINKLKYDTFLRYYFLILILFLSVLKLTHYTIANPKLYFNVSHYAPSKPTAYPQGYAYHRMDNTALNRSSTHATTHLLT